MSMTIVSEVERLAEQVAELRALNFALSAELNQYRSEDVNNSFLQRKTSRQTAMLHRMNRRVRVQRLILRELAERDNDMANELYNTVFDKYSSELANDAEMKF